MGFKGLAKILNHKGRGGEVDPHNDPPEFCWVINGAEGYEHY